MNNNDRKQEARRIRLSAADIAYTRVHPDHIANGDEHKFRSVTGNKPSYWPVLLRACRMMMIQGLF